MAVKGSSLIWKVASWWFCLLMKWLHPPVSSLKYANRIWFSFWLFSLRIVNAWKTIRHLMNLEPVCFKLWSLWQRIPRFWWRIQRTLWRFYCPSLLKRSNQSQQMWDSNLWRLLPTSSPSISVMTKFTTAKKTMIQLNASTSSSSRNFSHTMVLSFQILIPCLSLDSSFFPWSLSATQHL